MKLGLRKERREKVITQKVLVHGQKKLDSSIISFRALTTLITKKDGDKMLPLALEGGTGEGQVPMDALCAMFISYCEIL
jgi:hypothetical protein